MSQQNRLFCTKEKLFRQKVDVNACNISAKLLASPHIFEFVEPTCDHLIVALGNSLWVQYVAGSFALVGSALLKMHSMTKISVCACKKLLSSS